MQLGFELIGSALLGFFAAAAHLWMTRRAAAAVPGHRPLWALVGMPLRIGLPAAALVTTAWLGPAALITAIVVFAVTHRLGVHRLGRRKWGS